MSSERVESGRNIGKLRNNICLIFRNRKGLHLTIIRQGEVNIIQQY